MIKQMVTQHIFSYKTKILSIILSFLYISGCSVTPQKLSKQEIIDRLKKDRKETYANAEPIKKPLTLFDSIARAVKYNMNYKVRVSEAAIGLVESEAVSYEMLPDLISNASYINRDNKGDVASPSTGQISAAKNRETYMSDLNLSWNILDFGISYYTAKQKSNEYLILEEKKKTILQEIVRDTRTAYWASLVSNFMMPQLDTITKEFEQAVEKSREQEDKKLLSRELAAEYRVQLWETAAEINKMKSNLDRAQLAFFSLINAPSYQKIKFNEDYVYKVTKQQLPYDIRELELLALHNRPEIREEILQNKIDIDEIYKAKLKLIPNPTIALGGFYDSTTFLKYQFWKELSTKATWNLLKLFSKYYQLEVAKSTEKLGHLRRQALAVSIITQINVAYARVRETEVENRLAREIFEDNLTIYENAKKRKQNDLISELKLIEAKVNYMESKYRLLTAHYDKLSAYNELLDAIGYNSINQVTNVDAPISQIAREVKKSFNNNKGFFISYDEIKKIYANNSIMKKYRSKKISEEFKPDKKVNPKIFDKTIGEKKQGTKKQKKLTKNTKVKKKEKKKEKVAVKANPTKKLINKKVISKKNLELRDLDKVKICKNKTGKSDKDNKVKNKNIAKVKDQDSKDVFVKSKIEYLKV